MLGPRVRSVSHQVKDIKISFSWCGKLLSIKVLVGGIKGKKKTKQNGPKWIIGWMYNLFRDGWRDG